jgi:hypothetical protein
MTESKDTDAKITNDTIRLGGDTARIEMVEEITQLSFIPEVREYFQDALTTARVKFKERINEYRGIQLNLEKESKEKTGPKEDLPGLPEPLKKSKTYFFELSRVDDIESGSPRWEVGKFKMNVKGNVVNMIFSEFINRIDEYETEPTRIQTEIVYSSPLDKYFQISFTKISDTRVVGFVKEADREKIELLEHEKRKKLVLRTTKNTVIMATQASWEFDWEEAIQHVKGEPEFQNMVYYLLLKRASSDILPETTKPNSTI